MQTFAVAKRTFVSTHTKRPIKWVYKIDTTDIISITTLLPLCTWIHMLNRRDPIDQEGVTICITILENSTCEAIKNGNQRRHWEGVGIFANIYNVLLCATFTKIVIERERIKRAAC